jgi:hypothetical protein
MENRRSVERFLVMRPEGRPDPGIQDGRTILKWIFKKWDRGHELDYLAQNLWRALVNVAMNLQIP